MVWSEIPQDTGEYVMSSNYPGFGNPQALQALNDDAKKAMSATFDAMSKWRNDLKDLTEKNSEAVFDKMVSAAKSVGWPTDFVEMSRKQMQAASKMQIQAVEQVMDVWEKQATAAASGKAPAMPTFPGMPDFTKGMPDFTKGIPGMGAANPFGSMPGMPDMSQMPMVPLQFWMQAAEMWQKSWQQALSTWMEAQTDLVNKSGMGGKPGGR